MRACTALLLLQLGAAPALAGDVPGAILVLEVLPSPAPGRIPEAAPPRFVLLEKGQVFVGGTSELAAGRLDPAEVKAIEARVGRVRKLPGLGPQVAFGAGTTRHRLALGGKRPLEIVATGDPAAAPAGFQPLASLVAELARFDHPSLRPYRPEAYALVAREGTLPGGCRAWSFPFAVTEAAQSPRTVAASSASDWPTGANVASVCAGDKRYVVTLRPLLPGERP